MTTARRTQSRPRSLAARRASMLGFSVFLAGCASSAIVEDGATSPWEAENNGELFDAGDLDGDEPAPGKPDTSKPSTPAAKPDAATPSDKPDAGSKPDASTPSKPDASTPGKPDASISTPPDASMPSMPSKPDAGGPPPDAAVPTNPNDGKSCKTASDCTQPCVPVGVFNCCSDLGTCGCTWAPGAYCL